MVYVKNQEKAQLNGKSNFFQVIIITTQCFAPEIGGIEALMTGMAESMSSIGKDVLVLADGKTNLEEKKDKKYSIKSINKLQIDVEGSEYKIMKSIDFNKVKILPDCDFILYCLRTNKKSDDNKLFKVFKKSLLLKRLSFL